MTQKRLLIAIPSYNRPEQARNRLSEITSFLDSSLSSSWRESGVRVILFENGQSSEYAQALAPYLGENIIHSYSAKNNGLYRNFLRCIETGDSDWIWILGDDDRLRPGALETIAQDTEDCSSEAIVYNNFSDGDDRRLEVATIYDLFRATTVSEALFMSGTIWRTKAIQEYISVFIEYSYTLSPQLSILLKMLEDRRGTVLVVNTKLLDHQQSGDTCWSTIDYMRRSLRLVDCLSKSSSKRTTAQAHWLNFLWAAEHAYMRCGSDSDIQEWRDAFRSGLYDYSQYISTTTFLRDCRLSSCRYLYQRLLNKILFQHRNVTCTWKAALLLPKRIRIGLGA